VFVRPADFSLVFVLDFLWDLRFGSLVGFKICGIMRLANVAWFSNHARQNKNERKTACAALARHIPHEIRDMAATYLYSKRYSRL